MAFESNIDPEVRGFYFASSGSDVSDGATLERPKQTVQEAIDACTTKLTPPADSNNFAQVSAAQGGTFTEGLTLTNGVQFDARNASFNTDLPIAVTLASTLLCQTAGVQNDRASGTCWLIDGEDALGVRTLFTGVFGDDAIGFDVKGACESLFLKSDQLILTGERAVGFNIICSSPDPIITQSDSLLLENDDQTAFIFNPPDSATLCNVRMAAITMDPLVTGTEGYRAKSGVLVITQQGVLSVDTAIHVESGAVVILTCENVIGDITVDSGGTLIANINNFSGNITNDGALSGNIGNTIFDPLSIIALREPDTTALVTHSLQGSNGGDSRSFYTVRDPKGNITGNPGDICVRNDGEDTRIYQHRGATSNNTDWVNISDAKREDVLSASSFATQTPSGTDTALQIEFGSAQGSGSDPVEMDASGNITINETGQYFVSIILQYGRTGAGMATFLFFRILIDGVQSGNSIFAKLDNENSDIPAQFEGFFDFTATEVMTVEFIRDSQGFDSGELMSDNPTASGWNDSASAAIRISRRVLE